MNDLLNQMATDITSMSVGDKMLTAMFVTLVCMLIVFFVLVVIMCIIKILEKFVAVIDKPKAQVQTQATTTVAPVVQTTVQDDEAEIVAVITATLQMLQQQSQDDNANVSHLLVSKISNTDTGITLWERGFN